MDEFGSLLSPEQENNAPSPQTEFNDPTSQSELPSTTRREDYGAGRREDDDGKRQRSKQLIRYVAAAAASAVLLAEAMPAAPPEREYVETESSIVISCAAVLPEEPEFLRFSDYLSAALPEAEAWERECYLVEPDGTETRLSTVRSDSEYSRSAYLRSGEYAAGGLYKLISLGEDTSAYSRDSGWMSSGNLGIHIFKAPIGAFREGSALKICEIYLHDGVYYRMSTLRPIDLLPPNPEITVSLEASPVGGGMSQAHFRAVFHPQEGDGHEYLFGDGQLPYNSQAVQKNNGAWVVSLESFVTRWYDAEHRFLNEGLSNVVPMSVQWPYPTVSRDGRDYILEYSGLVNSSSTNPDAAYYSLELNLVDASTGWHYLIESEQLPITR